MMGYFMCIKVIIVKDVWINVYVLIEILDKVRALVVCTLLGERSVTICSPKQKFRTEAAPVLFGHRRSAPWTWFPGCKMRNRN